MRSTRGLSVARRFARVLTAARRLETTTTEEDEEEKQQEEELDIVEATPGMNLEDEDDEVAAGIAGGQQKQQQQGREVPNTMDEARARAVVASDALKGAAPNGNESPPPEVASALASETGLSDADFEAALDSLEIPTAWLSFICGAWAEQWLGRVRHIQLLRACLVPHVANLEAAPKPALIQALGVAFDGVGSAFVQAVVAPALGVNSPWPSRAFAAWLNDRARACSSETLADLFACATSALDATSQQSTATFEAVSRLALAVLQVCASPLLDARATADVLARRASDVVRVAAAGKLCAALAPRLSQDRESASAIRALADALADARVNVSGGASIVAKSAEAKLRKLRSLIQ